MDAIFKALADSTRRSLLDRLYQRQGQTLSHYRILDKVGEGGMGEVYLAKDLQLERLIALKVLPETLAADGDHRERLRREVARAVARVQRPRASFALQFLAGVGLGALVLLAAFCALLAG